MQEYVFVVENQYMSIEALHSLLGHHNIALKHLLEGGYLNFAGDNLVAIDFVGVVVVGRIIICVLPKYYKQANLSESRLFDDFVQIIKVLRKIGFSNQIPDSKHLSSDENLNRSEVVLADKIIRDYIDWGLFNKKKDTLSTDAYGETNWDATISIVHPIFSKSSPIYHQAFKSSVIDEEYNLIAEIHKWAVKYSIDKFGKILDYNFIFPEDCVHNVTDLGSIDFLIRILKRELSITYQDREILLLKRIIHLLNLNAAAADSSFSLFGTKFFYVVWEKTCSAIFVNRLSEYQHLIPSPEWKDALGNVTTKESLKPDIISIGENFEELFFILDAKYYAITYALTSSLNVTNNPGVGDVSKQFLYERAFGGTMFSKKYNCFIFPKLIGQFFEVFGIVSFSLFPEKNIYNVYLSPVVVFDSYLKNSNVGMKSLDQMSKAIDSVMEN